MRRKQFIVSSHKRAPIPKGWRPLRVSERERYEPPNARSRRVRVITATAAKERA